MFAAYEHRFAIAVIALLIESFVAPPYPATPQVGASDASSVEGAIASDHALLGQTGIGNHDDREKPFEGVALAAEGSDDAPTDESSFLAAPLGRRVDFLADPDAGPIAVHRLTNAVSRPPVLRAGRGPPLV